MTPRHYRCVLKIILKRLGIKVGRGIITPIGSPQLELWNEGNIDTKPKAEEVEKLFKNITEKKERNKMILKAIEKGYSQHIIAKVLGISQQAVFGVLKRSRE